MNASATRGATTDDTVEINTLGLQIDGWADSIKDAGGKEDAAFHDLEEIVQGQAWPQTSARSVYVTPTRGRKWRRYLIIEMSNGATVVAQIRAFGRDLFAKWDLYVRPLLNTELLQKIAIGVVVLGVLAGIERDFSGSFGFSIAKLVLWSVGWAFLAIVGLVGLGFAMHRNPTHYFFKQLDEFDVDDIVALTLSAHKSMLAALDSVGIEMTALRVKDQFRAGSRERVLF